MLGDFDVTAGLGWGRLSDNGTFPNVFALVFPSFETRAVAPPTGGTPAFGQLFHGPRMGVFGAIDWRSPIEGLDVLAEYSSDHYTSELNEGVMKVRSPFNVGLSYAPWSNLRVTAGWIYGTTYGAALTYTADPTRPSFEDKIGPDLPPAHLRSDLDKVAALRLLMGKPDPHAEQQATLAQALMSEARGVRTLDVEGATVLIDAAYHGDTDSQCQGYARIAAASDDTINTVALTDSDDPSGTVVLCKPAVSPELINASETKNVGTVEQRIRTDVTNQRLEVSAYSADQSNIWLYYRNTHYLNETEAAGRLVRVLLSDAPSTVEVFHLVLVEHGRAIREFQVIRSAMERAAVASGNTEELAEAVSIKLPPVEQLVLDAGLAEAGPRFTWAIGPGLRESFFDPNAPIQIEIMAVASADLEVAPGLDIVGEADTSIYNNFDLKTPSASQLPHVRSDIDQYLIHGINGIGQLEADYRLRLAPDVYTQVRVGYLEDMYAGVGGQILWRPEGGRISVGADIYQVWKRDFDRLFGVQQYNILTGHISFYYNSPWHGLNFNLHIGRYLAGDYGGTIEVTRKFDTGVEIGAFATFTNVPFSKFGEGSFDKGFVVRIPFDWSLPFYTATTHTTILHSLTRDGGQRLYGDDSLYEETRSASYGEIESHLDQITNP
jgi:hypothetical protein